MICRPTFCSIQLCLERVVSSQTRRKQAVCRPRIHPCTCEDFVPSTRAVGGLRPWSLTYLIAVLLRRRSSGTGPTRGGGSGTVTTTPRLFLLNVVAFFLKHQAVATQMASVMSTFIGHNTPCDKKRRHSPQSLFFAVM